jgi:type I restriction enzyme R subunit
LPCPEQSARIHIDAQLSAAGWNLQDISELNLAAGRGIGVREMQSMGGPADYILFVDGKALGVVEAKKAGTTLSSVAEQSERYSAAKKWIPQRWANPLPFTYESTGIETNFRDQRDPAHILARFSPSTLPSTSLSSSSRPIPSAPG